MPVQHRFEGGPLDGAVLVSPHLISTLMGVLDTNDWQASPEGPACLRPFVYEASEEIGWSRDVNGLEETYWRCCHVAEPALQQELLDEIPPFIQGSP